MATPALKSRAMRGFAALATAAVAATTLTGCGINNGTGNYVGVVSRFQTDGVFDMCKTWEGEIAAINNRGAGGRTQGSTMHFTVKDPTIAAQIEEAMLKQTPIRVEFRDVVNPWKCTQESKDIITKVEKLDVPLNSPFAAGRMGAPVEGEGPAAVMPQIVAGPGKKVFVCTEADVAGTGTPAPLPPLGVASPPAPLPAAKQPGQLPEVLRLHK